MKQVVKFTSIRPLKVMMKLISIVVHLFILFYFWKIFWERKLHFREFTITWMTSFIKALSVDILAFFITETLGPTHVTSTNLARLLISSPVYKKKLKWIFSKNENPLARLINLNFSFAHHICNIITFNLNWSSVLRQDVNGGFAFS